ncbi:uncharacterized protein LOC135483518 [Lineus longissimus]|uniref:uncharacterized protein LOC135483518 n=1 Tax=Lineus longissimus TaxID=88925 RepID=UPI002B4CE65D
MTIMAVLRHSIKSILVYVLCVFYAKAETTKIPTQFPNSSSTTFSSSTSDDLTRPVSVHSTTTTEQSYSPTDTPITSTNSTAPEAEGIEYKPWEVFGVILLLALIAIGICAGIVIKKRRRRENRAKRLKDEPSVHYTSKWNRKNTADPPTKIFSSPVFVDPSSQTVREGSERCPSEDSVISSEVGEIRMKEDELSPSLNTIRSDDNIQGIGGACNVQNDVKESIYDVPPVHHVDTAKLVD